MNETGRRLEQIVTVKNIQYISQIKIQREHEVVKLAYTMIAICAIGKFLDTPLVRPLFIEQCGCHNLGTGTMPPFITAFSYCFHKCLYGEAGAVIGSNIFNLA